MPPEPRPQRADWIARALASVAILGLLFVWASTPGERDPSAVLRHPLAAPSTEEPCPLPPTADPGDLGDVMEVGFSPQMSRISFVLDHDDASTPEQKREAMIGATAKLLGCIRLAGGNHPRALGFMDDHYVEMMTDLRDSVAFLQLTAVENDAGSSRHWYDHTRKQCARCHLVYKPGSVE